MKGSEIIPKGSSFITWPAVEANKQLMAVNKDGCAVSPGIKEMTFTNPITVMPDSVSVVSYICSNATAKF